MAFQDLVSNYAQKLGGSLQGLSNVIGTNLKAVGTSIAEPFQSRSSLEQGYQPGIGLQAAAGAQKFLTQTLPQTPLIGGLTKYGVKFGQGLGETAGYLANLAPNKANQYQLQSQADTFRKQAQQALRAKDVNLSRQLSQKAYDIEQGIGQQQEQLGQDILGTRGKVISGTGGLMLQTLGGSALSKLPLQQIMSQALLTGGIGAGMGALGNLSSPLEAAKGALKGAATAVGELPTYAGLNYLTNPVINKAVGQFGSKAGLAGRAAIQSLGTGVANVGEDNLYKWLNEGKTQSVPENVQSFVLGTAFAGVGSVAELQKLKQIRANAIATGNLSQFHNQVEGIAAFKPKQLADAALINQARNASIDNYKALGENTQAKKAYEDGSRWLLKQMSDASWEDLHKMKLPDVIEELHRQVNNQSLKGGYINPGYEFGRFDPEQMLQKNRQLFGGEQATGYGTATKFSSRLDKKPRFEISDENAQFLLEKGQKNFGDMHKSYLERFGQNPPLKHLLYHDELYKNYPELKDVIVQLSDKTNGSYDPVNNVITLSKNVGKSTTLHEIQHAIQTKEGFATGGSTKSVANPEALKRAEEIINKLKQFEGKDPVIELTGKQNIEKQWLERELTLLDKYDLNQSKLYDDYLRLSAELESRAVQRRMNLTPEQRLATDPYAAEALATTGTTNPKDFITRFEGGTVANVDQGLLNEAKKYKSAEEFVKAQPTVYHGSGKKITSFDATTPTFFSPSKEYASIYSGKNGGTQNITEAVLDIKKPFDTKKSKEAVDIYNNEFLPYINQFGFADKRFIPIKQGESVPFTVADDLFRFLRSGTRKGKYSFDGLIINEGGDLAGYGQNAKNAIIPFDSSKQVLTKSQLTDIWNKAQSTVEPLVEEAKKYKSAEEFVNSKLKSFRDAHRSPSIDLTPSAEKMNTGGDFSMEEVVKGFHNQPQDYFDPRVGPRYYSYNDQAGMESATAIDNVRRAIKNGIDRPIEVYRTIPKDIKQTKLSDYDWVSPSKTYAENHGLARFGEGEYKVIKQEVKPNELWWDGNDIREWGYDSGKDTRKLTDIWNQANGKNVMASIEPTKPTETPLPWEAQTPTTAVKPTDTVVGKVSEPTVESPIPLTEAGRVREGFTEIPGKGVAKPPSDNYIDDQAVQEHLTTATMHEQDKSQFNDVMKKWIGNRNAAITTGGEAGYQYSGLNKQQGLELINEAERVRNSVDPVVNQKAQQWKQQTDQLYNDIKQVSQEVGMKDLGFIDRYVTHYWKETPKEVQEKLITASKSNPSLKERKILTYEDGIKIGLTPQFDNPAQIMSEYVRKLEQTKANLTFFKDLVDNGMIVSAAEARGVRGFEPITAIGFPKSTTQVGTKLVEGNYYAPVEIARQINKIFSPEPINKPLESVANFTRAVQDVTLSGGLPATPINAFSASQVQKELLAGRAVSPLTSFARSLSPKTSQKYFVDNAEVIKRMARNDVPVSTSLNTAGLSDAITKDNVWNKLMGDATFKRFIPMLQINLFKDIEGQALKGGQSADQAAATAAQAIKNFYGNVGGLASATENPNARNLKTTIFFAPKFREAMINFWGNNLKALKNPLALENRTNTKFLAGAAITYGVMNYLNNLYSGHDMKDNPEGKKDKLLIPQNDGTTIGIPFLSSIATVPRGVADVAGKIVRGDYAGATAKAGQTFLSTTLKPAFDVANNEDYFGKQIYDPSATAKEKHVAVAKYLGKQFLTHPWIKALTESKTQPAYQTISKALELPFRFYNSQSIANAPFWDEYRRIKPIGDRYNEIYDKQEKAKFYNENKEALDQYDFMKTRVKAYYDDNKNSAFLQNGTSIGKDIVIANGEVVDLNKVRNLPTPPKYTGNTELDKALYSDFSGKVTSSKNAIIELYKAQLINANQTEALLQQLKTLKDSFTLPKTYKSGGISVGSRKKLKLAKIKAPKIKVKKYKALKLKKPKNLTVKTTGGKIKIPKVGRLTVSA